MPHAMHFKNISSENKKPGLLASYIHYDFDLCQELKKVHNNRALRIAPLLASFIN